MSNQYSTPLITATGFLTFKSVYEACEVYAFLTKGHSTLRGHVYKSPAANVSQWCIPVADVAGHGELVILVPAFMPAIDLGKSVLDNHGCCKTKAFGLGFLLRSDIGNLRASCPSTSS